MIRNDGMASNEQQHHRNTWLAPVLVQHHDICEIV
jgi:hypothetical protein